MSWVALAFVPVILAYQAWSYWVFRKRISVKNIPPSPTELPAYAGGSDTPPSS
jgi:cytochrome d ubiquinol oxidase subunit II